MKAKKIDIPKAARKEELKFEEEKIIDKPAQEIQKIMTTQPQSIEKERQEYGQLQSNDEIYTMFEQYIYDTINRLFTTQFSPSFLSNLSGLISQQYGEAVKQTREYIISKARLQDLQKTKKREIIEFVNNCLFVAFVKVQWKIYSELNAIMLDVIGQYEGRYSDIKGDQYFTNFKTQLSDWYKVVDALYRSFVQSNEKVRFIFLDIGPINDTFTNKYGEYVNYWINLYNQINDEFNRDLQQTYLQQQSALQVSPISTAPEAQEYKRRKSELQKEKE